MHRHLFPLLTLVVLLAACGSSEAADPTTTSEEAVSAPQQLLAADGRLQITIPAGAAPATVSDLDPAGVSAPEGWQVVAAFDLGPDGSTFDEPVVLEYELDTPVDGRVPLAVFAVAEEGGWRLLDDQELTLSEDGATITSSTGHFSGFSVVERYEGVAEAFTVELIPTEVDLLVGDRFTVFWLMTSIGDRTEFSTTSYGSVLLEVDGKSLYIDDPEFEKTPYAAGAVAVDPAGLLLGQFSCAEEGTGEFGYSVLLTGDEMSNMAIVTSRIFTGFVGAVAAEFKFRMTSEAGVATCKNVIDFPPVYRAIVANLGVMGLSDDEIVEVFQNALFEDNMADGIYSISEVDPGDFGDDVDLWDVLAFTRDFPERSLNELFNQSTYECGATTDTGVMTVCPPDVQPMDEGDVVIIASVMNADLPSDGATRDYTYAAVFDADAGPAGNWQYQGDFDWDFYRDTDRWYQVHFDAASGSWSADVIDAAIPDQVASAARILIDGDTIMWVIPAGEFTADTPLVRVTAFRHDGSFDPATSGGDVSGSNPTEPPQPVARLNE